MESAIRYARAHNDRFLDDLFTLLRIPSISAESAHKEDMTRCAEQLAVELAQAGADLTEVMPTEGNPVVYAEKIVGRDRPTVLVYGHYDVMPTGPADAWRTPPFEPVVHDGRIWARGADDDKGQSLMHVKAMEAMVAAGTLPCNVKFMIEGEEEIGSESLYRWCRTMRRRLAADVIVCSDTSLVGWDTPSITCGLRGLCAVEVEVTGPDRELHSGLYGGAVANPAVVLAQILAALVDRNGHIAIPGFYDGVHEPSAAERRAMRRMPFDKDRYCEAISIPALHGEKGYLTPERTGIRPSLDVNGIWGGYTGEGSKTIIPARATAKVSMRLVPGQDWRRVARLFTRYVRAIAPRSVRVDVRSLHGGDPYLAPTDRPAYRAAEQAFADTFGVEPIAFYSGGSIPIVSGFEKILGLKTILMGFGLDRDAIHSPNESYGLENFSRGIETIIRFHHHFARMR